MIVQSRRERSTIADPPPTVSSVSHMPLPSHTESAQTPPTVSSVSACPQRATHSVALIKPPLDRFGDPDDIDRLV